MRASTKNTSRNDPSCNQMTWCNRTNSWRYANQIIKSMIMHNNTSCTSNNHWSQ